MIGQEDTVTHPALAGGPIYLDYNATTPVDPAAGRRRCRT